MATPTGLRQTSRDLGFPPQEQGQAQEGMPDLPPGFTHTQLESMIRELRTAAALEVQPSSFLVWKLRHLVCLFKSAHLSVSSPICLSVRSSVCLSVCLCVYFA